MAAPCLLKGQPTGGGSGSDYDRSRSGCFLLGCGSCVLVCALASANLRRIELSRFWIKLCFVSAIKRRHSGSGMVSSLRMVLSTISLVRWTNPASTISVHRKASLLPASHPDSSRSTSWGSPARADTYTESGKGSLPL